MPVEATAVDQPFDDAPQDAEQVAEPDAPQDSAPDVVQDAQGLPKRGRPACSKDKQPRRRPVSAAELPRPVTRRSAPPHPRQTTKRVQIESASEASESASEESPRTVRHRQWTQFRQHKQDAHQANVNKYVQLFDRMLA